MLWKRPSIYAVVRTWVVSCKIPFAGDVNRIINYVLNSQRSRAYDRLAEFGDKFGSRLTGTETLERSIS
jgi:hypothetical protein